MTRRNATTRRAFMGQTLGLGAAGLLAPRVLSGTAEASTETESWQVGMYTRPWDKHDYRVALDAIAETGFKHVGLMTTTYEGRRLVIQADTPLEEAAKIGEEVAARGLEIPSAYGGGIPVAKSLEAGIKDLRKLIDNCAAAKVRSLLMGGIGPKLFDAYYKAIAECCDYAAEKDLSITVKPHGGTNATGAQCRKCIETVGHDNFSLWYDPGNIFFYSNGELDPVDDALRAGDLVKVGMCIKDFIMRDKDGKPTRDVWLTPGTGRVDFPGVLKGLKKGGFTGGALVIECIARPDGPDSDLATLLAEAKKAKRFVEGLID